MASLLPSIISFDFVDHAAFNLSKISLKPGRPYCRSLVGGKYVPAKNGCNCGVSQTDNGQPPLP
jgi:hypothetical protein